MKGTIKSQPSSVLSQLGSPLVLMDKISAGLIRIIAKFSADKNFEVQSPTQIEMAIIAMGQAIAHADMTCFTKIEEAIKHSIGALPDQKLFEVITGNLSSFSLNLPGFNLSLNLPQNQLTTALLDTIQTFYRELAYTARLPAPVEVLNQLNPELQKIDLNEMINNAKKIRNNLDSLKKQ
ncbi:hypothetical protein DFH28DRAFT_1127769 [Melampsora americana]|nr:hypothetical protein DFH28DRAFT_1127769 [Melampsora americana]